MLKRGEEYLHRELEKHLSVVISYLPLGHSVFKVKALLGKTLFTTQDEYGITITAHSRDFIIAKEKLPRAPRRGDQISHNGKCYEVLAPNDRKVWDWSGTNEQAYRIHTKEIGNGRTQ